MSIKKNVPYKVVNIIGIATIVFTLLNLIGLWVGWNKQDSYGAYAFAIVSGVLELLAIIALAVCIFLNQKVEKRIHGWTYSLLALIHLVFVILTLTLSNNGNYATPALFTVFLIVIALILVYFAVICGRRQSAFGSKSGEEGLAPIRREDLGSNPTESTVDQVANPENNPDRKSGRDEKTGIVSL